MGLDGLEYLGRADLGSSRNAVALKGIGHQALSISLADFSSPDSSQTGLREVPATVELTGQCKISGAAFGSLAFSGKFASADQRPQINSR